MNLEQLEKEWSKKDNRQGELQAKLWDKKAGQYKEKTIPTPEENPFLKQVYEEMQIDEHTRILDIGCGAGRFSLALAKSGAQVTGTDVSSEMIMAAKELAEKEHQKNVSFFHADWSSMEIEKMGFLKNFDLVFAHMTPAVADYHTLEKMCNCSKNKCFLVKPSRRSDMVLDGAFQAAGIEKNKKETDTSVAMIFSYLWLKGYSPYISYRDEVWEIGQSVEDMLAWCIDRANLQGEVTWEQRGKMQAYLSDISENGRITERTNTTIVTMSWCVER